MTTTITKLSNQNVQTMTSREIAELTGKEHFHVKRDIETMMKELELDVSNFGCIYKDSMNRNQTEYALDRDLTDCLLTGYSAKARMAVIKRWKELESNQMKALPNFNNPVEAARAWADELEAKERLQQEALLNAPKVEAFDALIDTSKSMTLRDASKAIGMKRQKDFKELLLKNGYLLVCGSKASQKGIKAGYLESKVSEFGSQCRVTAKGLVYFTKSIHEKFPELLNKEKQNELALMSKHKDDF